MVYSQSTTHYLLNPRPCSYSYFLEDRQIQWLDAHVSDLSLANDAEGRSSKAPWLAYWQGLPHLKSWREHKSTQTCQLQSMETLCNLETGECKHISSLNVIKKKKNRKSVRVSIVPLEKCNKMFRWINKFQIILFSFLLFYII